MLYYVSCSLTFWQAVITIALVDYANKIAEIFAASPRLPHITRPNRYLYVENTRVKLF